MPYGSDDAPTGERFDEYPQLSDDRLAARLARADDMQGDVALTP